MNESDFLKVIEAYPCDPTPRLVYADWLDDHGDPRGELLRIQEELRHIDVDNRPLKEARMHALLNAGVKPLMVTRTNSIEMEFVLIFPGAFLMGSPQSEQEREVDEDRVEVILTEPFYLGRFLVTQDDWLHVMKTLPAADFVNVGAQYPATSVTWHDTSDFCGRLNELEAELLSGGKYTIPTEAQWEYCCRAGTQTRFHFGDDEENLAAYAWYRENTLRMHHPHLVGQRLPNAWGLYDMHGNVWEWCRDSYQPNVPGRINPEVVQAGIHRIARGGTWQYSARDCRSAKRELFNPAIRDADLGFRIILTWSDK